MASEDIPFVWGGLGEKTSNGGTQWFNQRRIYDGSVFVAMSTEYAFHPYIKESEEKEMLRIRKLTPCECLRLMAFTKEDYEAMSDAGLSASAIYHCAGDSIVVNCLIGLIGSMTDKDYVEISKDWADKCSKGIE